jgi:site-specific recombinase XerD
VSFIKWSWAGGSGTEPVKLGSLRLAVVLVVLLARAGTPLDAHNVRRDFRKVVTAAGLNAGEWTPRELHSFVSLLSDDGMPIEHIAHLVGHTSTAVTETVYRQQIRPVIVQGAEAMDRIFGPAAQPEP